MSKVTKPIALDETLQRVATALETMSGSGIIDDTAGSGDTDKVWSADKVVSELADKYEKPSGGIPSSDLASGVLTSIIDDTAGSGEANKVWSADKSSALQSALNGKYEKPVGGIPSTDLASGVLTSIIDDTAGDGDTGKTWSADKLAIIDNSIDNVETVLNITAPGTVNLFDSSNPNTTNLIPKTDGSGQITTSNGVYSVLLTVEPNSTVTMTKTDGNRCQICSFNSAPAKNDYWVQNVISAGGNTGLSVTITVGANDVYLLCYMATSTSSCDYSKVKIFYGTEWHDSTPNKIDKLEGQLFNYLPNRSLFNLVSNRPLGVLSKPYIAISCDDGANDLATTTIPLFQGYKTTYNKNIPLTMGLMSTSAVLGNATYTALVNTMLSDYGCEVATHGGTSYTSYSNSDLIDFLDDQEEFIYGKCGRNPVGIIYPNHAYDLEKKTIAGSYYGVCAAGYSNGVVYSQCNGARSNMYELHRWSLFVQSQTENTIKTVVDYAYDNNLLLLPWFHDNALSGADAQANTALLNYLVSYGVSKGIDFISFKDIPTLT